MEVFNKYLLIINLIGFLLYGLNVLLYSKTEKGQVDGLLTVASLMGGSLGILIFVVLFDRKSVKENMMSRVFLICILIIQIIIYIFLKNGWTQKISFNFINFFKEHKLLIIYLISINFITFALYALDKIRAVEHGNRIRITTLLGLAFIGGSLGALVAIYFFKHKTKKDYFTVGIPLIIITQIILIFFIMNRR